MTSPAAGSRAPRAAGAEVFADRSKTAIVLAGIPERGVADIELLPFIDGTDAVPALMQPAERDGLAAVAIDLKSNAATLIAPAVRAGLPVKTPDANDVAVSLGTFADLMTAEKLRHHNQAQLTTAVRFAEARRLAGAAALQRYGTAVDAAPAFAAELSEWGLGDLERPGPAFFATWR